MLRSGLCITMVAAGLALAACGSDDEEWLDRSARASGSTTAAPAATVTPAATPAAPGTTARPGTTPAPGASPTAVPGAPVLPGTTATPGATPAKPGASRPKLPGATATPTPSGRSATPPVPTPAPGSKPSTDPGRDERAGRSVVETFFKASKAKDAERVCRRLYTQEGVERRTGRKGEDAIKACEDSIRKTPQPELQSIESSESVDSKTVVVEGNLRFLSVVKRARIVLLLDGGAWKVDRIAQA